MRAQASTGEKNLEISKSQLKRIITNRRMFNVCRTKEVTNEN
jgi:hypothetical protein